MQRLANPHISIAGLSLTQKIAHMLPFNRGLSRSAQKRAPYSEAEVWMVAEGVVEPVGEIGRTDHQANQLN
jgi:hypothetical protein